MKYLSTFKFKTDFPEVVKQAVSIDDHYKNNACIEYKRSNNEMSVTIMADTERDFRKTINSSLDRIFLSLNTVNFSICDNESNKD